MAKVRPFGANAIELTPPWSGLVRGWPRGLGFAGSATSHSWTELAWPLMSIPAMARPSGLYVRELTRWLLAVGSWLSGLGAAGLATFHSQAEPLLSTLASTWPSALNAIEL